MVAKGRQTANTMPQMRCAVVARTPTSYVPAKKHTLSVVNAIRGQFVDEKSTVMHRTSLFVVTNAPAAIGTERRCDANYDGACTSDRRVDVSFHSICLCIHPNGAMCLI